MDTSTGRVYDLNHEENKKLAELLGGGKKESGDLKKLEGELAVAARRGLKGRASYQPRTGSKLHAHWQNTKKQKIGSAAKKKRLRKISRASRKLNAKRKR